MSTCDWPISLAECTTCEPLTSSPVSGLYVEAAVDFLSQWTKGAFGLCEITVRPCLQQCVEGSSSFWGRGPFPGSAGPWMPVVIDGVWRNLACGQCGANCGCGHVEQIQLPGPIESITEVKIDGVVLDEAAYRVDSRKWLVRLDGGQWPHCQDLNKAPTEDGTWEVTYEMGRPVPAGGQIAAGLLACEMAKAVCGDGSCQLPKRVTQVSRQNVNMSFLLDTFEDLTKGATGIWLVDSWVASVTKAPQRSGVYSPDLKPKARRTTWP